MIRVLLLDTWRATVDRFVEEWAHSLEGVLRTVAYESLPPRGFLVGSVFIFSDLDRLNEEQIEKVKMLARAIEGAGGKVLNHPAKVLRRHDMLRKLHEAGENPFNVYRRDEINEKVKFPVFLRQELQHTGALSDLLNSMEELKREMAARQNISDLLVVEYVHTAGEGDGIFRKYSAMRVGGKVVPRHILFSRDWVNKTPDVVSEGTAAEENNFVKDFPHREQVWKIFEMAGIEYGRIDYSILNGKLVTWEINTNPTVLPSVEKCDTRRLGSQGESARMIREAIVELAGEKPDVKVGLAECPRIVDQKDISQTRRWTYLLSHFWERVGRVRGGTRVMEAIVRSVELGIDQNPPKEGREEKSN